MAGFWRLSLSVGITALFAASIAHAFNGRLGMSRVATVSQSYVLPYSYYYCPTSPTVIPVPDARPGQAIPTPAPASSTAEPPLQKKVANDPRMPLIVTSHAIGGNYVPGSSLPKDRCRVGFWNLAGREVTLVIEGKAYTLPKDRAVTLDLERQFAWQVAGRSQHVERIAEGQASHEVVIQE